MKLAKILLATTLTVSTASVFATELDHATPAAPVVATTPTDNQEAEAATVQASTSEVSVEQNEKEKTIAQ